jgi:FtsH-binding integral membrane protein
MATKFEQQQQEAGESFLRSRWNNGASPSCAQPSFPLLSSLFSEIEPRVQRHLVKVYATLLLAVASAAGGALVDSFVHIGGIFTTLAALGVMVVLATTPATPSTLSRRTQLLATFAALQGASLGPLISLAVFVDPALIAVAFVGAALVFACFSLAALLTRRRSMLALGGILSTAVTSFLWLHAAAMLLPRSAFMLRALSLELYLGVFVFAGFCLVDTQVIVEKASAGNTDHVAHALDLFVDLAALFSRLLAVLIRNAASAAAAQDGEDEGSGRRRRRQQPQRGGGVGAARAGRRF